MIKQKTFSIIRLSAKFGNFPTQCQLLIVYARLECLLINCSLNLNERIPRSILIYRDYIVLNPYRWIVISHHLYSVLHINSGFSFALLAGLSFHSLVACTECTAHTGCEWIRDSRMYSSVGASSLVHSLDHSLAKSTHNQYTSYLRCIAHANVP